MDEKQELRTLKIRIRSHNGGKIDADLPLGILKPGLELGLLETVLKDHDTLKGIDFQRIMELAEAGFTGEIVSETDTEGDDMQIVIE